MEKPEVKPAVCEVGQGTLPGCAALAFPYIPMQSNNPTRYSRTEALQTGTLFPGLDLPFKAAIQARTKLPNTALVELMALDFAVTELNLYLDTHPQDQEALGLYASYIKLAKEGREKYTAKYGPLDSAELVLEDGYTWLNDPWPWELGDMFVELPVMSSHIPLCISTMLRLLSISPIVQYSQLSEPFITKVIVSKKLAAIFQTAN